MTRQVGLSDPFTTVTQDGGRTMFDDAAITQPETRDEDPDLVRWTCRRCHTQHRGTPRQRLLDVRDRWRRDWCRTCGHITVMERDRPAMTVSSSGSRP